MSAGIYTFTLAYWMATWVDLCQVGLKHEWKLRKACIYHGRKTTYRQVQWQGNHKGSLGYTMSEINVECASLLLSTLFHMLNDNILSDYMHYDVV